MKGFPNDEKSKIRPPLSSIFLNLKDPESKNLELATYNFKVNIFGSRASSFILAAVLKHHLGKYLSEEPLIPETQENLLVDNLVTGCSTEAEAFEFFKRSRSIFRNAAMNLRDWSSNNETINTLALAKMLMKPKLLISSV